MPFETRLTPEMIERFTKSGDWGTETFYDILTERAARHPDRVAIVDSRIRVTYGELKDRVDRTATALKDRGIGKGDVVTIQLPNWVEFAYVFFSLELLGAVANKVSPDFRARELDFILRFSNSRAYVCPSSFKDFDFPAMGRKLAADIDHLDLLVVVDGDGSEEEGLLWLAPALESAAPLPAEDRVRMDANDVFRMAFTSGTTGNPKCVLHSFNTTVPPLRYLVRDMDAVEDDVYLIYLPTGLNWGYLILIQSIMMGSKAVLLDRFSGKAALELIEKEGVTFIPTAPASIIAMLNEPSLESTDVSSLRVVITGGTSCPVETLRSFQERMSGRLIELYGMLEDGYHTYTRFSDDPEQVNGTIGRCVEGMGLRLVDAEGNDVPPGAEGEIAAWGPSVHLGYHNNPKANEAAFMEGDWFRTGDLGVFADDAGNVRIVGRSKEMINRGGKKFFPREIEEILYTHPEVLHAAIVGIKDERLGERNCLCVIPKQNRDLSLDTFVDFLKGEVATYKLPEHLEVFDDFPFTPTGKLQRFKLTEIVQKRIDGAANA